MNPLPPLDVDALLGPVDAEHPAGAFDEEDNAFQAVDSEMMKLGSLQEPHLRWAYVDDAARRYLTVQCKHFRVAAHLATVRMRTHGWRGWAEAVEVLAGMANLYWESGFPKPGAAGLVAKRRLMEQQFERLAEALTRLDPKSYGEEYYKVAQRALDKLQGVAPRAKIDAASLTRLEGQLRQQAEATRAPELVDAELSIPSAAPAVTEAFFSPASLTTGNEREQRRSLLIVADIINRQDAYETTGYLLRRFALWAHLSAAPSARRDMRTELMAVPVDTADAYWEALKNNAVDPVLLQRVEKSVSASPYWLRGSYLSAGIARRLEMPAVAEAIRHATERFVSRLPGLIKLQFSDGRPFVDGETQIWLSGADNGACLPGTGQEYPALRDELRELLEAAGVEAMLRRLEQIQQTDASTRHHCHVMTLAAELLDARGLTWLAQGLFVRAHRLMSDTSAPAWEPDLFNLLERHAPVATERTP